MTLGGFKAYGVSPFETAPGYTTIITTSNSTTGIATANVTFVSGTCNVNDYHLPVGKANYELKLGDGTVRAWTGDVEVDNHSATRIRFRDIEARQGDEVRLIGQADSIELAPIDCLSFLPPGIAD